MITKKYRVVPLEGTVTRTVIDYIPRQIKMGETVDAKGGIVENFKTVRERQMREVQEPGGFMVLMHNGNSLRVRDAEELARLGFSGAAPLIDTETGEEVPQHSLGLINQGHPIESLIHGYNPEGSVEQMVEQMVEA